MCINLPFLVFSVLITHLLSVRFPKPFSATPQIRCWFLLQTDENDQVVVRIPSTRIDSSEVGFSISSFESIIDELSETKFIVSEHPDDTAAKSSTTEIKTTAGVQSTNKETRSESEHFDDQKPKSAVKLSGRMFWTAFIPMPTYSIIASTYNTIVSEFETKYKQKRRELFLEIKKREKSKTDEEVLKEVYLLSLPEQQPSDDLYRRIQTCLNEAPINATTLEGRTLMHACAAEGSVSLMKQLVQLGANINAQDSNGFTPLHLAIKCSRWEAAEAMLNAPLLANPHLLTLNGSNVLHGIPLARGDSVVANDLIYEAPTDLHDFSNEDEHLHVDSSKFAIDDEDEEEEEESQISFNVKMEQHEEESEDRVSIAQVRYRLADRLINEFGVDVNHISGKGFTPLHFVTLALKRSKWQLQYAEMLLKVGASPNFHSGTVLTPFMYSIKAKNKPLIELMIKYGGDPDFQCNGKTAVLLANATREQDIIEKVEERSTFPMSHLKKQSDTEKFKLFANKQLSRVTRKFGKIKSGHQKDKVQQKKDKHQNESSQPVIQPQILVSFNISNLDCTSCDFFLLITVVVVIGGGGGEI